MQLHVQDHDEADQAWRMLLEQSIVDEAECWIGGIRQWQWSRKVMSGGARSLVLNRAE